MPFLATGATLTDVKKGELTLRVGIKEVHFNFNQGLKQLDFEGAHCMRVDDVVLDRKEMKYDFMNQDLLEECIFKSPYKENLEKEQLNASVELIETMLNLSKGNEEDVRSIEVKVQEQRRALMG